MSNSVSNVPSITIPVSVKTAGKGRNATKREASRLADIVLESRNDKRSSVMAKFMADLASNLHSEGCTEAGLRAAAKQAEAGVAAAIAVMLARAIELAKIPAGTTGAGGIHYSNVVTELFTSQTKKAATEANTKALRTAGLI